jgi:soluble lytic murein transglycosylase-like protein
LDYASLIFLTAKKIGVAGALLMAICTTETNLRNVYIKNDHGSPTLGVCGVKHATAQMIGYDIKEMELMNPDTNIEVAGAYLKYQLVRYGGNLEKSIAAYNAGRFNESQKLKGRPRNLKYVKRVMSRMREIEKAEFKMGYLMTNNQEAHVERVADQSR